MKRHTSSMLTSHRPLIGLAAATLALLLTGCAGNGTTSNFPTKPARQLQVCHAEPVQIFIGHNTAASTLESIRQKSDAYLVRVLRENQPATMDFNQERLNVITNEAGKITALRCG